MSKINISFDNVNYNIDEESMSKSSSDLKTHLTTVMNGNGSVVKFDGISYNIDSEKLTNATNVFVSHIGTVSGNGSKVTVNGVNYGIDSAKLINSYDELRVVLNGINSGSDNVIEELLTEQSFSFEQNYRNMNGDVTYYDEWYADLPNTIVFTAGETYKVVWDGQEYTLKAKNAVYHDMPVTAIGNMSIGGMGVEDTGEPFAIASLDGYPITQAQTLDQSETHTIAIYKFINVQM